MLPSGDKLYNQHGWSQWQTNMSIQIQCTSVYHLQIKALIFYYIYLVTKQLFALSS